MSVASDHASDRRAERYLDLIVPIGFVQKVNRPVQTTFAPDDIAAQEAVERHGVQRSEARR